MEAEKPHRVIGWSVRCAAVAGLLLYFRDYSTQGGDCGDECLCAAKGSVPQESGHGHNQLTIPRKGAVELRVLLPGAIKEGFLEEVTFEGFLPQATLHSWPAGHH